MTTATVDSSTNKLMPSPLEVDSLAPYFSGIDQNGEFQSLDRLTKKGPFVIIFYRGHWCYFCRKQVTAFQKGLDKLSNEGFPIILVTPEKPEYIQKTVKKTKIKFPVLHDNLNYIMTNYKVAKPAPDSLRAPFTKIDLKEVNNTENPVLPVPATYIVGADGMIKYRHFDLNYALRASFKTVADKVREINQLN